MHPIIPRQLRMKARSQNPVLPYQYRITHVFREYCSLFPNSRKPRRPNKNRPHRPTRNLRTRNFCIETFDLRPIRIAIDIDVENPPLREQNCPRTRPIHRHPTANRSHNPISQSIHFTQHSNRRTLPTRHNQTVQICQIRDSLHAHRSHSRTPQTLHMFLHRPLHIQNPNSKLFFSRFHRK